MSSTMMASRMICTKHNFQASVGSAVQYTLDYYECPACVAEVDAEYELSNRPCCPQMNTTCCGHDDDQEPAMTPAEQLQWSLAFPSRTGYWFNTAPRFDALTGLVIDSPNHCDGDYPPF